MQQKGMQLVECPRDAMQGWHRLFTTGEKIAYLQQLLSVGFHTLDCVSFVSPKAIPQMADSHAVLQGLDLSQTNTELLAIVANQRGAEQAVLEEKISYLGFPFSVSPTFQRLNANSTPEDSLLLVEAIQALCQAHQKQLVVYLSMGFGNPYGDAYHADILLDWLERLAGLGIRTFSLSDTVGLATAGEVYALTQKAISAFANCTIGVHLHSTPLHQQEKLQAALDAGCTRIDGAIMGIGGCPMAQNDLVGNMDTLYIVQHLAAQGIPTGLQDAQLREATLAAGMLFGQSK